MKTPLSIALSLGAFLAWIGTSATMANPSGANVAHGTVRFTDSGPNLDIRQDTQLAVINWQSFSIAPNETTNFIQPNGGATLNRVVTGNPSALLGRLNATGTVMLINPNGILVGPQGQINTAGFLASTLDVKDEDFLDGGDLRFRGTSEVSVTNLGKIVAREGDAILLGNSVVNGGRIEAPNGTAALAAGEQIVVMATGEERVFVEVGSKGSVVQKAGGSIQSATAEIKANASDLQAAAVSVEGVVEASGVVRRGGRIFLSGGGGRSRVAGTLRAKPIANTSPAKIRIASEQVEIAQEARIETSGPQGGEIVVVGGSEAIVDGTLDATGSAGEGGSVLIVADELTVGNGARVDASGATGGGEILVGGGRQGVVDDRLGKNAASTVINDGAAFVADSLISGDAGRVIVWADGDTDFAGAISASALGNSGDGGFIEISGKQNLTMARNPGSIGATSVNGEAGHLLIDPLVLNATIIANTVANAMTNGFNTVTYQAGDSVTANANLDFGGLSTQIISPIIDFTGLDLFNNNADIILGSFGGSSDQISVNNIDAGTGDVAVTVNQMDGQICVPGTINGDAVITDGANIAIGQILANFFSANIGGNIISNPNDPALGGNANCAVIPGGGANILPFVNAGPFGGDPNVFWNQIQNWIDGNETDEYSEHVDLPPFDTPDPVPSRATPRDERILRIIYEKQKRFSRINALLKANEKGRNIYRNLASAYASAGTQTATEARDEVIKDIDDLAKDTLKSGALRAGSRVAGILGDFVSGVSDANDLANDLNELSNSDDLLEDGYSALFGPMFELVGAFEGLGSATRDVDYANDLLDAVDRSVEADRGLWEEARTLGAEIDQLTTGLPPAVAEHFNPQTEAGVSNLYNWFR